MSTYESFLIKVRRYLHVDRKTKKRIIEGLKAEIDRAIEDGEKLEDVLERMGTEKAVALEYNRYYRNDLEYQEKRKYKISKRIAVISLLTAVIVFGISIAGQSISFNSDFVSHVGGASAPTNVVTTSRMISLLDLFNNTNKVVPVALFVFVLSTIYCVAKKFKRKGDDVHEKK